MDFHVDVNNQNCFICHDDYDYKVHLIFEKSKSYADCLYTLPDNEGSCTLQRNTVSFQWRNMSIIASQATSNSAVLIGCSDFEWVCYQIPITGPLLMESTGGQWNPLIKGQ